MTEMRRKKCAIQDRAEIEAILKRAQIMHLAMSKDGQPYVVPLNFGFHDGAIYFHTGLKGMKMDFLEANDQVCFEVDIDNALIPADEPCKWSQHYLSVVGFGRAVVLEDPDEKVRGLKALMAQYTGREDFEFPPEKVAATAVVRIDIEQMTGRHSEDQ
jgi:nitroimidazol reductase NimA-like FMN-containing flavoprotein (pyridoxamine 5'-phosphate oxidase superfamily)